MENILINNAYTNNLKNVDVSIPLNAFTCVTGVSGCGKSSLIYDTLYAESQREFLEFMSGNLYGQKLMDKPKVDSIYNLRPSLNIAQKYYNFNPRSTVGTLTDISYYLRALFALVINFESKSDLGENYFSPNNASSCCKRCKGLGEEYTVSEELLCPDKNKSLKNGAILYYKGKDNSFEYRLLEAICEKYNIDINKNFSELTSKEVDILLYRKEEVEFLVKYKTIKNRYKTETVSAKGAFIELIEKLENIEVKHIFNSISKYLEKQSCSVCNGSRLNEDVLSKKIGDFNIAKVESLKIVDLINWVIEVKGIFINSNINKQVEQLCNQIINRSQKIIDLKVGYVSLDRQVPTLSGGEIQRIRIANQLNCSLKGLVYILDEPCKGLHIRDINSIISSSKDLVLDGNTVIAIEHNKKFIAQADRVIELGPEGGPNGGYIISNDTPSKLFELNISLKKAKEFKKFIELKNINFRNIKNQNVSLPVGSITFVTGVSGSGKSTLVSVISQCIEKKNDVFCDEVKGLLNISSVMNVNQQPIGKTPRSTVVSYIGIYDNIRTLFEKSARDCGSSLSASDFSVNVEGGRCECCQGSGTQKIELTHLPDSYIICPECQGRRFKENILKIKYKGFSINEILDNPIDKIIEFFKEDGVVYDKLLCMQKIGLGYLQLGQMSMTLSGGEAQRVKLAKVLGSKKTGKTLYILDEPTSGLNDKDIQKFQLILEELNSKGETILIIEHNIEFIAKNADYLIDFGKNAGDLGGEIVAQGTPDFVFGCQNSSLFGLNCN